ncbi:MAG: hypothetical protein U0703_29670 [Anaerolineae bacterium]
MDEEYDRFIERYPAYAATSVLDDLRAADYARLDQTGQIYLDYTSAAACTPLRSFASTWSCRRAAPTAIPTPAIPRRRRRPASTNWPAPTSCAISTPAPTTTS